MVNKLFLIAFLIIVIDRISKFLFSDISTLNKGAAFGILPGYNWLFIAVAIIVIIFILYHFENKEYQIGMGFLLGGTIGNLIDRVFYAGVIDFISILMIPTFNISDVANIIGALLLIHAMHSK
tara:strand:+ start:1050 stop:1418 length:369 start_codon:yes stop_codon:yes gene_type:complete